MVIMLHNVVSIVIKKRSLDTPALEMETFSFVQINTVIPALLTSPLAIMQRFIPIFKSQYDNIYRMEAETEVNLNAREG